MTVSFIGPQVPVSRILTGFWSLDNATMNNRGERGWVIPSYVEVYGKEGVGKTNFAVSIAGLVATKLEKDISFLDFEIQDMDTIADILERTGFDGTVRLIREKKDEECLEKLLDTVEDEHYGVGLLDSIAAISPISEQEGKIGDANMGRRAMSMAQFSRKSVRMMQRRESPFSLICTNHSHPTIGGRVAGTETSGGVTHKFMAHYRILLSKAYWKNKTIKFDDGWLLKGRIEKSRMGYAFRDFYTFMVAGEGLHKGLSAMFDCLIYEYAELSRTVKMDGESYGTIKSFIENRDNTELFVPFENKLRSIETKRQADTDDEEYEYVQEPDEDEQEAE